MESSSKQIINILAIDGGGIRGIIPATILSHLEAKVGRQTHEIFDLIAGTSTGGIIAAAIGAGAKCGAAYRPSELVDLYVQNGPAIFRTSPFTPLRQFLRPKYSPRGLEGVLKEFFGDTELASAKTPLLIASYDIDHQMPFFFKSQRIPENPAYNWMLRDVSRATSAAPTFFPPVQLKNGYEAYTLVDGGVCANNPAVAAYAEARRVYPQATDILVVSVGTGDRNDGLKYSQVRAWGLVGWARRITSLFMDSVSETSDYELYFILGKDRNYRLQPELRKAANGMDCVSPENMRLLREEAEDFLAKNLNKFDPLCSLLKARLSRAGSASAPS
jgi:hypothetical protein